jgi:hypothetical protein
MWSTPTSSRGARGLRRGAVVSSNFSLCPTMRKPLVVKLSSMLVFSECSIEARASA